MTPVGETLRRERLKRNLQLAEISNELKISTRFLQAIESDQFDKLPGGLFAKSFVRQYARLLGLDEEAIAGEMQQALAPAPEVPGPVEKARQASVAPIQVPKVDEWETVGDKRFRWSGWLSAVVLVVVMLVCSAVYAWMQRPKSPVAAQASPPKQSGAQSAPAPAGLATQPAAAPDVTVPPPSPVAPAAAAAPAGEQRPAEQKPAEQVPAEPKPAPAAARVTPPNPEATVHVEIAADETVWVLARADGKYAFSATMDARTTRTVDGVKEVTVRLGNAGGVTISLNGKPIGPAGPRGQVRTIQFTSGGFQIVAAKPPAAPADRL
jgi:cytoskeleton protein RodZ